MKPFSILGLPLVLAMTALAQAQENRPQPITSDRAINTAVVQVIKEGVRLFNEQGDSAGCYQFYRGGLTALRPLLADRPDLQNQLDNGLGLAASKSDMAEAAFTLRDVLNDLYASTRSAPVTTSVEPLWERLGGEEAVKAVVHDFVQLAAVDPDVNFFRDGQYKLDTEGVERLERLLVELISSATGGPLKYSGRNMKDAHEGMKITDAEFKALAADLVAVLRKYKVPEADINALMEIIATTRDQIVEIPSPSNPPTPAPNPIRTSQVRPSGNPCLEIEKYLSASYKTT